MSEQDHNKLITRSARVVLRPEGLFQKGSSRIWVDDNGWYLVVVEFQPSSWDKGSYLNVGINYLWEKRDYLAFEYGHRVGSFVRYSGDDAAFCTEMLSMAETAMDKVREYRSFRELQYAKEKILHNGQGHPSRRLYQCMMICGLCKDIKAEEYYNELQSLLWVSETKWEKALYNELLEEIAPIVHDPDRLYGYICGKIKAQREFWRSKANMKKLQEQFTL